MKNFKKEYEQATGKDFTKNKELFKKEYDKFKGSSVNLSTFRDAWNKFMKGRTWLIVRAHLLKEEDRAKPINKETINKFFVEYNTAVSRYGGSGV